MSSGKRERASMREGPLADLFRKTETEGLPAAQTPGAPMGAHPEPPARDAGAAGTAAFMSRPREEDEAAEAEAPSPRIEIPAEPPRAERRIPSPQERLRAAFSSDIPLTGASANRTVLRIRVTNIRSPKFSSRISIASLA